MRNRLRRLLDEKIPSGGTEADTRFTDDELGELLKETGSLYKAASLGWTEKAGMYQREMGEIRETTAGQESYKLVDLKERQQYALRMAKEYWEREESTGSFVMTLASPEVL